LGDNRIKMKKFARLLAGIIALMAIIGWILLIMKVKNPHWPMEGAGDNAVNEPESGGEQFFGAVIIGLILLLPMSPYLSIAAGAFNLITGKSLRIAYFYSLIVLSLMTLILLATLQPWLELIALANVVIGVLWIFSIRGVVAGAKHEPEELR
jgi:hypothetical protein